MTISSQQHKFAVDPIDLNKDYYALHARNGSKGPKSFHIQVLNPFRMISGLTIWPFLDCFLRRVNSRYYCVNAEHLVRQFNLAINTTVSLTNLTMCTLCLCISIGCQVYDTGTDEMAIMWYENGRRYLDSEDWGWSLDVMRALTLISIFHIGERPTTASHYLGILKALSYEIPAKHHRCGSSDWRNQQPLCLYRWCCHNKRHA